MHLHNHLKDVILDHGPLTSFWCFSFERVNGILGSTTTNKRSVERQLMRKFLISRDLKNFKLPVHYHENFSDLCSPRGMAGNDVEEEYSLLEWSTKNEFNNIATKSPMHGINWQNISGIVLPSSYRLVHFDVDDLTLLKCVYKIMYPEYNIETRNLSESMHRFGSICIWSTTYGSKMQPRGIRSSKIMASWPNNDGQVLQDRFCLSAGSVQHYFKHSVQLEDQFHQHCFACVRWYIPHANR